MIRPLNRGLESRLGGQAQLEPGKERFGRYPPEKESLMLTWSFGVHDPKRTDLWWNDPRQSFDVLIQ